jgi:hypothetical protein
MNGHAVGRCQGKRRLRRTRHRWEKNIKMNITEIRRVDMKRI